MATILDFPALTQARGLAPGATVGRLANVISKWLRARRRMISVRSIPDDLLADVLADSDLRHRETIRRDELRRTFHRDRFSR